jgi:hypothetical protein
MSRSGVIIRKLDTYDPSYIRLPSKEEIEQERREYEEFCRKHVYTFEQLMRIAESRKATVAST